MNRIPLKLVEPAPELPKECCAKCHFVLTKDEMNATGAQVTTYACRRYPPNMMFGLKPVQDLTGAVGFGWESASAHPPVRAERWCGEFKPYAHSAIVQ